MRWLSWIVMLPLAAAAIVFSVSNRAVTPVDFWPFGFIVELPVFGIVLASLLLGFVIGGLVAWWGNARQRSRARAAEPETVRVRSELAALREESKQSIKPDQNRLTHETDSRMF
ncbi:MAG: lipopolysaccharide assembly protein LapA domain-containing protein [Rhodospirillales bacterium]